MNTLIFLGLLFSACLAFAMALPMASSGLPVADVAVVPEEEMLQPAESRYRGGYGGGYGRGYGGNRGYGGGRGYGYGHGGGRGYGR